MRRRIVALAVSALMAGGTVAMTLPAQTASAKAITCDTSQMRQQVANLKAKAQRLKHEGEYAAARRALAQADAIQKKLNACIKGDNDASKPFPR
ncbi:hypothetical protein [Streptomyces sp. I05A-00742]|uniref:hypothetical protein n=1 Tax=Streptomyces sp. I05A-00742 TaxID=2732853 RepID=UPI0014882056|nr:hypothetical protein [Streptomyces sp. I05A-00742]